LPPSAGNYADLTAVSGKLVYRRLPKAGSRHRSQRARAIRLTERNEQTILDKADGSSFRQRQESVCGGRRKFGIIDVRPAQKFAKPMATADIEVPVDPRAEWKQIFMDTYRFERDLLLRPQHARRGLGGDADQYLALLADAVTRWDVNFILGEFIGDSTRPTLPQRRRTGATADEAGRDAGRGLGAGQRCVPHQENRPRRPWDVGRAFAARRAWRRREGG
jgi:tricorn protease